MATATKENPAESAAAKLPAKSLVWFGALPAEGPVEMMIPTRERSATTQDYHKIEKVDPADLWCHPGGIDEARIWVGKCRWFQTLGVRGFNFPAYSEVVERQATIETEMVASPFPGAVTVMAAEEIEAVARSCWCHVIRFKSGNKDIYALKHKRKLEAIDLDLVVKPAGWTEEQWIAERQRIPMEVPRFDPTHDVHVAHFVYLVPVAVSDLESLFDTRTGELDAGACLPHLPHQRLDRKFFASPPISVAEAFPQFKS